MKVFISFAPQQEPCRLKCSFYEPDGNERLLFRETRFPILTAINGYAEAGETIRVLLVQQDKEHCRANTATFLDELSELCESAGIRTETEILSVPMEDDVTAHIVGFQKLIDRIQDGDELYACLTYGSKPAPIVELMALRFARMARTNAFIRCIVYGQNDWESGKMRVYDVTALARLDDLIRLLAQNGTSDVQAELKRIISH